MNIRKKVSKKLNKLGILLSDQLNAETLTVEELKDVAGMVGEFSEQVTDSIKKYEHNLRITAKTSSSDSENVDTVDPDSLFQTDDSDDFIESVSKYAELRGTLLTKESVDELRPQYFAAKKIIADLKDILS